jgi:Zn-dependent protease with chaperone function
VRLVFFANGRVQILGEGVSLEFPVGELQFASRIGNTPRAIALPNHGKCEVADNDALDAVLLAAGNRRGRDWLHRMESSLAYVMLAVVVTGGFAWGMVTTGIPWMAEQAANALPPSVDRALGQGTLDTLDRVLFSESTLDPQHRQQLGQRFLAMTRAMPDAQDYRLEFRNGESVGANAFALPSGIVVVTDELVGLSENDDEVVAVLAHELGHLQHRHSLRMVMQGSALALLAAAITGDPFSTSTLALALPTVLVHSSYSRDFETEADSFAYDYLVAHRIPVHAFADIMQRLAGEDDGPGVERYLSSHPATAERIQRFRNPVPAQSD